MAAERRKITVNGFDRESEDFRSKDYAVAITDFTTVLDALLHIKERQDQNLSFRYSCRMGICGSCAMVINGEPRLACETIIKKMHTQEIRVEPMRAHPLLKGLVTDFDDFFEKHKEALPWVIRNNAREKFRGRELYRQTAEERDSFLPFAECIKCGLCVDACPVSNTNKDFMGPQALAQAYRYNADSKDEGGAERLEKLDTIEAVWGCEFAGACSKVCPKSVDPALAIQMLKEDIAEYRLLGGKKNRKER